MCDVREILDSGELELEAATSILVEAWVLIVLT